MDIGKPQREIFIEPIELPEPLRTNTPAIEPMVEEPATVEAPVGQ